MQKREKHVVKHIFGYCGNVRKRVHLRHTKQQNSQTQKINIMKSFKLSVTETGNKAAKYLYQVIDAEGNIVSERRSNREYVACTASGEFYFGRLDLIGKGDHGRHIKNNLDIVHNIKAHYADYATFCKRNNMEFEDFESFKVSETERATLRYNELNEIAYK